MLSPHLPQKIGARIEIPNDESGLMARVEAFGFFAEHIDGERIVLRRRVPNEALRGRAAIERAKPMSAEMISRIRVLESARV